MHTPPAPMNLLAHDLELASRGTRARELLDAAASHTLSTFGLRSPVALALALQAESPQIDELVGRYLEAASRDDRLISVALVACETQIEAELSKQCGRRASRAVLDELGLTLLDALTSIAEHPVSERREILAAQAVSRARAAARSPRSTVQVVSLDDDHDRAVPQADGHHRHALLDALGRGLEMAITPDDRALIEETRLGSVTMRELSDGDPARYAALRKRRSRAEARVRRCIELEAGR